MRLAHVVGLGVDARASCAAFLGLSAPAPADGFSLADIGLLLPLLSMCCVPAQFATDWLAMRMPAKAMLVALKRDLPLAAPPLDKFSNIKECPNGTWQCLLGNFVGPRTFLKNKPSALKILSEQPWLHEFSIQEPKAIPDVWGRRSEAVWGC